MDYLRAHYNIEDFIYYNYHAPEEHGHMHHFVLNPVFQTHCRHFLNVCKTICYYCLFQFSVCTSVKHAHTNVHRCTYIHTTHTPCSHVCIVHLYNLLTMCTCIVQEVLRVTQKTSIYYPLYPAGLQPEVSMFMCTTRTVDISPSWTTCRDASLTQSSLHCL